MSYGRRWYDVDDQQHPQHCKKKNVHILCHACSAAERPVIRPWRRLLLDEIIKMLMRMIEEVYTLSRDGLNHEEELMIGGAS